MVGERFRTSLPCWDGRLGFAVLQAGGGPWSSLLPTSQPNLNRLLARGPTCSTSPFPISVVLTVHVRTALSFAAVVLFALSGVIDAAGQDAGSNSGTVHSPEVVQLLAEDPNRESLTHALPPCSEADTRSSVALYEALIEDCEVTDYAPTDFRGGRAGESRPTASEGLASLPHECAEYASLRRVSPLGYYLEKGEHFSVN